VPDLTFEASASLGLAIEGLTNEMKQARMRSQRLAQLVHPFKVSTIPMTITSNAGTLNVPNMLGPQTGYYWDVKRITATGFSAGTVTVTLGAGGGETLTIISAAGSLLLGKAHILLSGSDNLYFTAASITGTVAISLAGIEIAAPVIGEYLL
jgi:predicted phage tail protein